MPSQTNTPTDLDRHLIDTVARIREGIDISVKQRETCNRRFEEWCEVLTKKYHSDQFEAFSAEDTAAHYLNAWRMAVIDPQRHGGWPYQHGGLVQSLDPIRQRPRARDDPFLMAAVIIPAYESGETEYAVWMYRRLARSDAFWTRQLDAFIKRADRYHMGAHNFRALLKEAETAGTQPPAPDVYRRQ